MEVAAEFRDQMAIDSKQALMHPRELSYRCSICKWQGQLEPLDAGDAAPCPLCGVYLYPLSWTQTWGVALLLIGVSVATVLAVVFILR
jgi:hypothetical protein